VDERKLEELFRDAASAAPPASFDEQDVLRGSRRVTARRRMAVAGGSLAAVAVLAGVGVGTGVLGGLGGQPVASPPSHVTTQREQPRAGNPSANAPPPVVLGSPNESRSSCGAPDEEVGTALAQQLPEIGATRPVPARGDCVPNARSAAFVVRQGSQSGRIVVFVSPASTTGQFGVSQRPDGTRQVVEKARSGKVVTVLSDPDEGSQALYGERLPAVAGGLAGRF
jgi:hypothetical protein